MVETHGIMVETHGRASLHGKTTFDQLVYQLYGLVVFFIFTIISTLRV